MQRHGNRVRGNGHIPNKHISIDHLENRRLLSNTTTELVQEPITIGVPGLKDITFVATSGRKTTISVAHATAAITFPGPAALTLYQGHAFFPAGAVETISSIVVANAIPGKAVLKEVGAFGTGDFDIPSIVGGDLGQLNMPDVIVTSSLTLNSVARATLGGVSAATVNFGTNASVVKIGGPLSGTLVVGSLGFLSASSISSANITTTAPYSHSKLEIGEIDGGTGILNSDIISSGNIGTVKAGYISGSLITAATDASSLFPAVPNSSLSIIAPAEIKSVRISSGATDPAYFSNSVISADKVISAQLGQITGGGIAAEAIGGISAMGPSGVLDRFPFHLGPRQLSTAARVQTALTNLGIPFSAVPGSPEDTVFYSFSLNLLI